MDELRSIRDEIKPDYTFLVCDAMTGQDAVSSASTFNGEVGLDGVCLTKMDGDARGGAALSIRAVTGKPIVFVGTGERPEDLEEFIPDRIASRILGMGDVVSLVEKAQETMDAEEALRMQDKIRERKFDFDDFLKQMRSVKRMGSLKGLLGMIPGLGQMLGEVDDAELEGELKRVEAIINSMTKDERGNDEMLRKSGTRRMRVAKGSGTTLQDVTELLRQFDQAKGMMQAMLTGEMGGLGGLKKMLGGGGGMGGAMPPGMPGIPAGAAAPRGGQGPRFMKKKKKKKRKGR
jgi:signal recognition particle subunit SRP54